MFTKSPLPPYQLATGVKDQMKELGARVFLNFMELEIWLDHI
jgi:hypothetical protein